MTTPEDTELEITLGDPTDVDGETLTYAIVTRPAHGSVCVVDNIATYAPALNYNGPDSFTFKANDGLADSSSATVSIMVNAVNDAPVADDQDDVTTDEETSVQITLTGTDIEGAELTYAIDTEPDHGTVTLVGNIATYTPAPDYFGEDSFTFTANDGLADSDPATITINVTLVQDAPVAEDQEVETPEDNALEITLVATDVDDDELTYAIVDEPVHGTVNLVDGVATYTPALHYFGEDSFTFKANDGLADSNTATVTITVTPVNDAPVAEDQDDVTTPEKPPWLSPSWQAMLKTMS